MSTLQNESATQRGVLLMAYGAPNSLDDVEGFYTDIRGGRRPSPELLEELMDRYRTIGGRSPLLEITTKQADAVQAQLGPGYRCYIGMRHWQPRIAEAVQQMHDDGIREGVALVMAPHFSRMSTGRYMQALDEAIASTGPPLELRRIESWHTHPKYLDALVSRVRIAADRFTEAEQSGLTVLFTAHSLPERIREWNDPYPEQLKETAALLADRLSLPSWRVAYQSAGRTPDPWLGPDILEVLDEEASAGRKAVLVCVIGFIADHLEVLFDVDVEARDKARQLGVHLERIDMLNDDPQLVECLADLARGGK